MSTIDCFAWNTGETFCDMQNIDMKAIFQYVKSIFCERTTFITISFIRNMTAKGCVCSKVFPPASETECSHIPFTQYICIEWETHFAAWPWTSFPHTFRIHTNKTNTHRERERGRHTYYKAAANRHQPGLLRMRMLPSYADAWQLVKEIKRKSILPSHRLLQYLTTISKRHCKRLPWNPFNQKTLRISHSDECTAWKKLKFCANTQTRHATQNVWWCVCCRLRTRQTWTPNTDRT